jgi:cyanophycinase
MPPARTIARIGIKRLRAFLLLAAVIVTACSGPEKQTAAPPPPQPDSTEPAPLGNLPTQKPKELFVDGVRIIPARSSGIAVAPLPRGTGRGELILHGGGRFGQGIGEAVVARAGPDPRLCLIETAEIGDFSIEKLFVPFAHVELAILDLQTEDVARPEVLALLDKCTAYFFGGGDPKRLSTVLRPDGIDSPALAAMRRRFEQDGILIAGASAGAMVAGPVTLCECGANSSVHAVWDGQLFEAPGFEFLLAPILIDAHFFARGLMGRHLFALARDRLPAGVGIEEDTAVLVSSDQQTWRVIGRRSAAVIYTPPEATMQNLEGFGLALLVPGDEFNPATGKIALRGDRRQYTGSELSANILEAGLSVTPDLPITYQFEIRADTIIATDSPSPRAPDWLSGEGEESVLNARVSVRPAM